ncbi:MAG: penicillin acylase family protein [bacterium]|nr:penicillin acylase family protein [bacterium]
MNRSRAIRRRIIAVLAALIVGALVLGVAVAAMVLRRPLPSHSGTVTAAVESEVRIERDARGVPHIYASTDEDLFYAQGYVHAQDRFFEMDYRRHVTSGRLGELVGEVEDALAADAVTRTLGWRHVAEQEWDLLSRETQSYLTAYAAGVNAYLEGREASELAMEYTVLGLQVSVTDPEPWTPIDSLAWLKAMAWDLIGNYDDELGRAATYQALGSVDRVDDLFPSYPYNRNAPIIPSPDSPVSESDTGAVVVDAAWEEAISSDAMLLAMEALGAVPELIGRGDATGSNSFVVAGEHTESGLPLLANDPHLGLGAPAIWYQVGLHCTEQSATCTFDVGGFSFSGMPGVIIGHNDALAWGLTNMGPDVADFFLERVHPDGTYEYDGERIPLETRTETVRVNGGEDRTLEIRSTHHGPLITWRVGGTEFITGTPVPAGSPTGGVDGYHVALQWTALEPGRTIEAIFAFNRARTAQDIARAAALFEVPAQAIVFATVSGDIGFQAPGRIPVRDEVEGPVPSDGTWPRPGWDPAYDWQGFIPSSELPSLLNPDEGFIVAANQAVTAPDEGPFLSADFDPGYRSQRIRALLNGVIDSGASISVDHANQIMLDTRNPLGEILIPSILRLELDDDFLQEAVDELEAWRDAGYPNDADSAGAAFFNATWAHLVLRTFGDEVGADQGLDGGSRWVQVVHGIIGQPQSPLWDDITTVSVTETRDEILLQSLKDARAHLTRSLGKTPSRWEWGDLHRTVLNHPILAPGVAPGPIAWLTSPAPFPTDGGIATVNANSWSVSLGEGNQLDFTSRSGPSMRMVVDLADLDASTWVVPTGVSGHPSSGNYTDQLAAWRDGEVFPWHWSEDSVAEASTNTLTLRP